MVSNQEIEKAVKFLSCDQLVAFPTETVYGLGADATSSVAISMVYLVKRRPIEHPLIIHIAEDEELDRWAVQVSDEAEMLASAFWPGPLTLILHKRADGISDEATAGLTTVGLRMPRHPVAQQVLKAFGGPLAAPSANRFGKVSPTTAQHVHDDLGSEIALILDGGPCQVGVESTIVDCTFDEPRIVRVGGITTEEITEALSRPIEHAPDGSVAASGTLPSHYAPQAHIELCDISAVVADAERLLEENRVGLLVSVADLREVQRRLPDELIVLESPQDLEHFARDLYARLREADTHKLDVLLVVPPERAGIGAAIYDRLTRAAAPRPH